MSKMLILCQLNISTVPIILVSSKMDEFHYPS